MVATPAELVERARSRTGLTDLGADGWQEGLTRLLDAVGTEVSDEVAVASIEELVVGRLATRLEIEGWYAEHADEADVPVEAPVIIVGLPRTGTTALHYLLALDDRFRYLRRWEMTQPVPPPELATEADDPRRRTGELTRLQHITTADGPAEDGAIQNMAFGSAETVLPVPSYTAWWRSTTHAQAFAFHERVLRLLHSHRPPSRWLLKYPNYVFQLPEVVDRYPDARFVMTHRDPSAVIPSTCSVVATSTRQRVSTWSPEVPAFGRQILEHHAIGMRQAMRDRARLGEERFLDVAQHELERDPIATAERIYEFLDQEIDDALRRAIGEWAAENQRGSRGTHRYSAEEYGLTNDEIEEAFSEYIAAYGEYCRSSR